MPRTPKPALRKPKPRSPRPTSRLPISAHGICPFRAPSFFLRNFFSAPCADAAPLHRCRADAAGSGTMGIRPPRRRRRSPGSEVRVRVRVGSPGQGCGTESGSGFLVGLRAGAAKAGCRSRVPRAASDRRKQGPEGVFCTAGSDVPPAKAPEPRVGIRKVCRKTGCGACGSGAGFGLRGRFRGRFRELRLFPWSGGRG